MFVDAPLRQGAEIALRPAQAHYLGTVMRRGAGDPVRLFNGSDGEWQAHVVELRRGKARCVAGQRLRPRRPG